MTAELTFPVTPLRMSVLISGGGTTLRNLLQHIEAGKLDAKVDLVVSSSATSPGLRIAEEAAIPTFVCERKSYDSTEAFSTAIFSRCREAGSHLVVMGGFLKLVRIPEDFQGRVTNIHPSLIPSFCGKGFYGRNVHAAVLEYGSKITGCTVHFVDNEYDHGPVISQHCVPVADDDTPESLAARVFEAECAAYPEALQLFASGALQIDGRRVRVNRALTP